MFGKTPVSALEEYCAKKSYPKPTYEICESTQGDTKVFICVIEAIGEMAEGTGRSKKEAKHDCATNILKKLKVSHPDVQEIPQTEHETIPVSDAVADLRDLCLQLDHPFPSFEIVQQDGPPEAPEFVVECRVATIKRFGVSSTKKGAKQLAAKKIINIIRAMPNDNETRDIATLAEATEQQKTKERKKIQTYREYIDSDNKTPPGTLICDRHNYFKNFEPKLKNAAWAILRNNDQYFSSKEKANELLKALEVNYKISDLPVKDGMFKFIELQCDLDVVFANYPDKIWDEVLEYFVDMLD